MATDQRPPEVHTALRGLLAEMIGPIAIRGDAEAAAELTDMLRAVFGVDLTAEQVLGSPSPGGLADAIEAAWFEAGGTAEELSERLSALIEDD
jgi:hypothetical protein